MERFDTIVVGGGLAGSTAGILLAEKGWRVLILERSQFPKDKICGEFLSPAIWPFLERLRLIEKVESQKGASIDAITLSWPHRKEIKAPLSLRRNGLARGYGISRRTLDTLFLAEAKERGCEVSQHQEVQRITKQGDGFEVETRDLQGHRTFLYEGALVVNAAGRSQRWRGSEKKRPRLSRPKIGFKAHFEELSVGREVKLFFFRGGYLGLVDVEKETTNLCGLIDEETLRIHRGNFDFLLNQWMDQNPALGFWLEHASRTSPWLSCRCFVDAHPHGYARGLFPVGDAAHFVEPFLGQGMTLAMASSFLLASFFEKGPPRSEQREEQERRYKESLGKLYSSKLTTGHLLGLFTLSTQRASFFIQAASFFPPLLHLLVQKALKPPTA